MKDQARIAHHAPGRIRIRLPHAKGDHARLEQIKRAISPRPGVRRVEVNPSTGSVVVHYDPALHQDYRPLLGHLVEHEGLCVPAADPLADESLTARSVNHLCKQLSDGIRRVTNETVALKELFPFGVAAYALWWVDRSIGAPLWLSLLIFSWSSYMDLHEDESGGGVAASLDALRAEVASLRTELRRRAQK